MTLSRRELLGAGAASLVAGVPAKAREAGTPAVQQAPRSAAPAPYPPNLPIREYLVREARRITTRALADFTSAADFKRQLAEKRRQYLEMMGVTTLLAPQNRPPVPFTITGVVDRPAYRIEKLHYQSLPDVHVTANLYVPKSASPDAKRPGVLYVCGHAPKQKVHYQGHPKRLAELGFPTMIVETVQLGETPGFHHGPYREGWFHWYSRGYSPAAIELVNGVRGLDLLAARPEVDAARLGVTGISGGGAVTWWIAAADPRVTACSPVCGTATVEAHVYDRVIDGHCDCMWWNNTELWDLADIGALIAPRPLLIASADHDGIFPIDAIRRVHAQLQGLYKLLDKPEHLQLVETPGGHSYHERSRTAIFSWFLQHLTDRKVAATEVGDIELDEGRLEPEDTLRVYTNGTPPGDRATTIQDGFITLATPPAIATAADVEKARRELVAKLKAETFNHFPRKPPELAVKEEFSLDGGVGTRFAFTSEEGWRLHGTHRRPREGQGLLPVVVILRSPGEERLDSDAFAGRIDKTLARPGSPAGQKTPDRHITAIVEPRGTGDTSWGEDLNWHVRRASAWLGRTIASMRVWDTLRALEAVRLLQGVDPGRISLAARGEMSVVALYAALLDGRTTTVFLESPPATQNAASQPNGRGPAIEMLNCLRHTDLPQVAGLLYPARIVISGEFPAGYEWAAQLYGRLGGARFERTGTQGTASA